MDDIAGNSRQTTCMFRQLSAALQKGNALIPVNLLKLVIYLLASLFSAQGFVLEAQKSQSNFHRAICSASTALLRDFNSESVRSLLSVKTCGTVIQCQVSYVANVAYATGLALLGASRHPMKNFLIIDTGGLRHSRVFPCSVG